jgi:cytochrome c oxidase subunit II
VRRHIAIVGLVWVVLTFAGLIAAQVTFEPLVFSDKGATIDGTFRTLLTMSIPVMTFVVAALGYSVIAFRHRGQPDEDGAPITGRGPLPLGWFVVTSAMALGVMVYPGLTELPNVVHLDPHPANVVRITGQQWSWSVNYPASGAKSTTELVLPVNKPVGFEITSLDVIHSVWIPAFRMRIDAVPGLTTYMSFTPTAIGDANTDSGLRLQCSQLCGSSQTSANLGHAEMVMPVRVVSDADFAAWQQANTPHVKPGEGQQLALTASAGAANKGFDETTLTANATDPITINFANNDPGGVHNVAIKNLDGSVDGATDFKPGPGAQVLTVLPLAPGTYEFLCQAHPTTMKGTLVVK